MNDKNEDEGFLALLKPIQDLTRNWEVDLSLRLQEYITYIRQICGDNIPDMNFAQAAVLLQNSANIYSKKVDFLFTTVLQLLDTLTKKHRLISGDTSGPDTPRKGRRTDAKKKDGGEEEGGAHGPGRGRRRAIVNLDTEEFALLDDVCAERNLTLDIEKERQKAKEAKKQKIVLNAAIKVKAKEKTSCNIYNYKQEVMGKKEEFRLNWRICSAGTLHEEFIISKNRFKSMEPVEVSMAPPEDSHHDYSALLGHEDWDEEGVRGVEDDAEVPPNTTLNLASSVLADPPPGVERESDAGEQGLKQQGVKRLPDNVVDTKEIGWQPSDFNDNIPEKTVKKRKVAKVPNGLNDDKKRKHHEDCYINSYTITDVLLMKYMNSTFCRDLDMCYEAKMAFKHKRQMLLQHRAKYQALQEKEAGINQVDEFQGFYKEGEDSDEDNDFEGFGDVNDDGDAPDIDVPLPDKENGDIIATNNGLGWRGDDLSSYDNEALKTMQAYRSRKIDHGRMTDMARRVEEWHQKILPKLESAEQRSGFDVHEYGTKILNHFNGKVGTVRLFEEVVGAKPREEVARYFLSTLMLANQYNLEISETEPGNLNTDCVQLKLLSTVRHHEELDDNLRHTSEK